ncbi:MAG: hypothetical protein KGP12_10920 [Actinomycetales bacterium]|nr:hypothetical protein [Actinomycetales bacterium]
MEPADAAFARMVHERVLNALHLLVIGQARVELLRATLEWIDVPDRPALPATDHGLAEVIREAVRRSGVAGVEITCPQGVDPPLSPQAAEALSAAVVEALRNAERHAQASLVSVRAGRHAGSIQVEVRDDGRGLDSDATPRLGLAVGITQAMASVAGTVQIRSDAGHGTVVQLAFPTAATDPTTDLVDGRLVREWPAVAVGARRLMADLLADRIDRQSPGVTDRARIEDGRIRTWLDSARVDSWMARQVAVAVGHAADHGRRMTATITGRAGISEPLDLDLAAALTDAEAIMLTVEPDWEELLVIVPGDARLHLAAHLDLPWRIEHMSEGMRGLRIRRGSRTGKRS